MNRINFLTHEVVENHECNTQVIVPHGEPPDQTDEKDSDPGPEKGKHSHGGQDGSNYEVDWSHLENL